MQVRDIMQSDVKVCTPASHLATAGNRMAEGHVGFLPVVGDNDELVGVITDRDICLALAQRDRKPSEVQVRHVMSGECWVCRAEDDVREALKVMRERRVRRLPVVDSHGRHVKAILSLDDVVLEARAFETEGFTGPFYADIAMTLKAIAQHQKLAPVA